MTVSFQQPPPPQSQPQPQPEQPPQPQPQQPPQPQRTIKKLIVEVVDARDLLPKDGQGSSSAYVVADFDGQRKRTATKYKDLNPVWNEPLEFVVSDPNNMDYEELEIEVLNDKRYGNSGTDIPSTVDRIMFPEVPIALRMSGHLLLGVVRIYSKKVEYLHHDCNVVLNGLKKAFVSIDLTLPENAMQAPLQSITMPENYNLDAFDCGVDFDYDGAHNDHQGNQEDITLIEQFPIATNPYVAIDFDEELISTGIAMLLIAVFQSE